ncbi:hypothetical protein [Halovibrio sp. HP20-50]|uniref:hypothetical protein n=1 Tax=Halovibrio sp. HP20-59 TaxID=3080275 RepID=UPI00294B7CD7|nr:hypothetical protein [Halovibrio sp. HP20-59]MEA2120089.1 hypothetical protein [Halovibrio sp. HP20-59]
MLAENLENWAQQERRAERQKVLQETEQRVWEAEQRALESKRNAVRKLIARTEMDDQAIAEIADLSVEEVDKLRAETRH